MSTPFFINQKVYYAVDGLGAGKLLVRAGDHNNLVYWDDEREMDLSITSFETGPVGEFEAHGRQCASWGRVNSKPAAYEGPAGRWTAIEVNLTPYGCADAGELQELYVDNIGMVRRVINTIAGPRTLDLVRADVGKQTIAAGETSHFLVSALPGADGTSWDVTLRVAPNYGVPVTFPSGQEYDLRLRDAKGNILWTWSANKLFVALQHSLPNIGGYTATESVPFPAQSPEGIPSYILEAWLTTDPNGPQFAAAVPLNLVQPAATAQAARARR